MDLQQSLDRFKADLQAYIQAEVSRQLAAQMRNIASGVGRTAPVQAQASVATNEASIQASLDALAELAQSNAPAKSTDAVQELVSTYGSNPQFQVTTTPTTVNTDYMKELEQLGQLNNRSVDTSAYEKLISMSPQSSDFVAPQLPQPTPLAATETSNVSESGQMSGIQSFLDKIRHRKNLSSN